MRSRSIAMLHFEDSPHPSHDGFADVIGADLVKISSDSAESHFSIINEIRKGVSIRDYDVLLSEGSRPLYGAIANNFLSSDITHIYLCADHRLYEFWTSSAPLNTPYNIFKYISSNIGRPGARVLFQNGIDGIIAVSEFASDFMKKITEGQIPIRQAKPYIQQDRYEALGNTNPALESKSAITIGQAAHYKGVDLLVEAWPRVQVDHPDAELHVVGDGHPKSYENTDGVTVHGFVEDLPDVISRTSLYVQPSRMDAFSVSVVEALRAGLPAVVTETTGAQSEVKKIDSKLIVPSTPDDLANAIHQYFSKSVQQRQKLSEIAKQIGKQFDPVSRKNAFKEEFADLLWEIDDCK